MKDQFTNQGTGTAWIRIERDHKWINIPVEDLTTKEFIEVFDKKSAGFLDYLAEKIRWYKWFLKTEGYQKEEI